MSRVLIALIAIFFAIALTAIALTESPEEIDAYFDASDCVRAAVTDSRSRTLRGIEDIAPLPDGYMLISAYDRDNPDVPGVGIYLLGVDELDPQVPAVATAIDGILPVVDGFRPHGIATDRRGRRLAFVNRYDQRKAEVVWGELAGFTFRLSDRWEGEGSCRANDLAWRGGELVATIDRGACGLSVFDLVPGATTGRAVSLGFNRVADIAEDLSFPNGILTSRGDVLVAETRKNRIVNARTGQVYEMPGGPDNMLAAPGGTIVTAVHPSLFTLWQYRAGFAERAPSRVVQFDPATGEQVVLFDDPAGAVFPAATSAHVWQGRLVMSSAHSEGMVVCEKSEDPA